MEVKTPLKRHPALVEYSRDHHFGLLLVWKIRQGQRNAVEAERISRYVFYFFEKDLKNHFQEEEDKLFSKMPAGDSLCEQALTDHQQIFDLIEALSQRANDCDLLNEFANTLETHIRFEE